MPAKSRSVADRTPDRPATRFVQNSFLSRPRGQITPTPVTTTGVRFIQRTFQLAGMT